MHTAGVKNRAFNIISLTKRHALCSPEAVQFNSVLRLCTTQARRTDCCIWDHLLRSYSGHIHHILTLFSRYWFWYWCWYWYWYWYWCRYWYWYWYWCRYWCWCWYWYWSCHVHVMFMSCSCQIHVIFMSCSCHVQIHGKLI